ncbi:MAG: hypothetical protein A3J27_11210 [Candidatus Tectomicrobia bacterium RIFCSPLOWO2_12_FULL_69_37]|nr:MAG: hypothetical protein A3J27_11210 [Candidatus Tectomicrobia bacterium RIFCSPLOWO2_12_FULL_69_37]
MGQYDINLRDYWRIIRKRKIIVIFTIIVLGFFSFVFAKLNEPAPIYSASSAVRIEQNTALSGLVSDASSSLGAAAEITTQTAVIRSYPVMEQVAKELGMVDKSLKSDDIAKNSRLVSVINGLAGQANTSQVGDTNIISITITSGDPDQAARMANTIASVFRQFDYENRNQTVLRQHDFIKGQLTQSERRLKDSERIIKEFKEAKNFLSLSVEATSVGRALERLQEVVSEQKKILKRIREAIEQVRNIRDVRAGKTERVPVDDIDPGLARLNQQLVELQVQRDNLLQEFTPEHPAVSDILLQISNVVRQMLIILEGREKTLADITKAREGELNSVEGRNKEIPDLSLQLQRFERQLATDQEVHNMLRQKFEEVSIRLAGTQHLVRIVKPAFRPLGRDNPPQIFLNSFVGALLGLVVGLAFALVLETMDTSIGTIEDVEAYLEVPVLGVIPILDNEELERQYVESNPERAGRFTPDIYGRLVTHFVPRSPIAEAYRSFRTQMEFVSVEKGGNTFVITSSTPGEGKTTTSINFAITCAQSNKRTLLIDADMRKPVIYRIFGIDREPGLTDILLGNNAWADCIRTMTDIMLGKFDMEDIMLTPGLDNLNLLTCGHIPPNPSELLNSNRMTQFLEEIRNEFDVIVIDTPPLLPVTDAAILGTRVDGCVLVYRVGAIARGALKRAKMQLDNVRAKVWGVVLNSMRPEATSDIDSIRYQSTYYYGGYTEERAEANLADLPFYQRWYRQTIELISPSERDDVTEEASPLAKGLAAAALLLSLSLLGAGAAWQMGAKLPIVGSLTSREASVGAPPKDSLAPLGAIWKSTQEAATPASTPAAPATPQAPAAPAPGGQGSPPQTPPAGKAPQEQAPAPSQSRAPAQPAAPVKPRQGASLPPLEGSLFAWTPQPSSGDVLTESAAIRRAVIRLASQTPRGDLLSGEESRRPYSIVFSHNRNPALTRHHLSILRQAGLSPSFVPVRRLEGSADRVFLGAFASQEEAKAFIEKHLKPLLQPGEEPYVDRLPFALEVGRGLAPGEADVMRVIVKAADLHPTFEEAADGKGRMLIGAFRSPSEAEQAAILLQREKISFQLVTR